MTAEHEPKVMQLAAEEWQAACSCGWVELARTDGNAQQMADTHVFRERRA